MTETKQKEEKAQNGNDLLAGVIVCAKRGRDPMFKCSVCGKFIAYEDIPDRVNIDFTPNVNFSTEATSFTHLHCL